MKARASLLFVVAMVGFLMSAINAGAVGALYVTNKADVPVWDAPSSRSTLLKRLPSGTPVSVAQTVVTSTGAKWGKTYNSTWVFMGNLSPSNRTLSSTGQYITAVADVPLRRVPSSSAEICDSRARNTLLQITGVFYNDAGNEWGTTADGFVVYMPNLREHRQHAAYTLVPSVSTAPYDREHHRVTRRWDRWCLCGTSMDPIVESPVNQPHVFSGVKDVVCDAPGCGFQRPPLPPLGYYLTRSSTVPLRDAPSESGAEMGRITALGSELRIVSVQHNPQNNVWGKTDAGQWVWMNHVQEAWLWPVKDNLSVYSEYGWRNLDDSRTTSAPGRTDGREDFHNGLDISRTTVAGLPVRASRAGRIEHISRNPVGDGGLYVTIRHSDGLLSRYMHLRSIAEGLSTGVEVTQGAPLGLTGNTHTRRIGEHLHFDIKQGSRFVNPNPTNVNYTLFDSGEPKAIKYVLAQ